MGHIYSAADINFSGEYIISLTGTQADAPLSHQSDPLISPT